MPAKRARTPILYLIDKLHRAGAQNNLRQLVLGLDRARFEPLVVCLTRGGPVAEEIEGGGVEVLTLGVGRIYAPRGLKSLPRLAGVMRERDIRIIHTYMVSSNIFGALAARIAGTPVIVTTRRDMGFSRNWRLRWLEETLVNPRVSRVVVPSEAVASVTSREKHLAEAKVITIPNGIDIDHWRWDEGGRRAARARFGLAPEVEAVGVIANFLPVKGHVDFLHAAAEVAAARAETRFFLVGDGESRKELEALSTKLGLDDRLVFMGRRDDAREILAMLDLCVLPSHSEGMSNVLLEAMSMERPVVATAVGGNTELVEHGVTGLLAPPKRPEALAASMLALLRDPAEAARMGREGRRFVASHLSVAAMLARYESLYGLCLSEARPTDSP